MGGTSNLDEANRAKLQAVANKEPLALIEYWAVDPDYDGQVFRSVWQDYRGNMENDGDPLRVVTQAILKLPVKDGSRRVCVRAGTCSASRRKRWRRLCHEPPGGSVCRLYLLAATLRAISCLLCRSNAISDGCNVRGADKVPSF